jgi:EmrB/QacA subfamily drug resistance transporter
MSVRVVPDGAQTVGVDRRIPADVWRVAVVVLLGLIMSALDMTIVNIALDTLSRDLHTTIDNVQWLVSGYLLALAATVPVTGWAARRIGGKRLFMISVVIFTVGSLLCGLASSVTELIAFRVLQGVGGGMIMPVGQMIVVKKAGPARLPRVMSAIGVPMVLAPVLAPTLGGFLLATAGWRWIFFINLPIGVAAVVAAAVLLPRERGGDAGPLDFVGLGLVTPGLVGITYSLANLGTSSFVSARVLLPMAAGVGLVAAFVVRSLRVERPLLDVRLFANKAFSAASLTAFTTQAALLGSMILMPLYFQIVRGESATATGLLLIPTSLGSVIGMWTSGRSMERFGAGMTALIGGVISVVSTVPFVLVTAHTPYPVLGGAMIARGFGAGLSVMPAMTAAFQVVRPEKVNDAAPQLNVVQRIGGSIGTAITAVVLQNQLTAAGTSSTAQAAAFATTYLWVVLIGAAAIAPTVLLARAQRQSATARSMAGASVGTVLDAA